MRSAHEPAGCVELKCVPSEFPIDAAEVFEEWMQKITALKGCGARAPSSARETRRTANCWASAKAAVGVLFGACPDDW